MTLDEVKNTLNMGFSNDLETRKLCVGLIKSEFPNWISYEEYIKFSVYGDYMCETIEYFLLVDSYVIYLRNKYCPWFIYSGPRKLFI